MAITTTAYSAFQKIFLDIVGPLEQDVQNNRYILTIQCELSKFVEAYPIPNKEAVTVAESFVQNFILRYGIPQEIVTDQGTEFLSSTFKEACKVLGIKQLNSTVYHHETLGALENSHKHLGAYLRIQVAKHPNSWSS
ncbi:DDE-type integrase/transposase/recombinase, partial [Enterobacter cloacae complex sp. 2DZ2F20B]|uniref:integrase catalytic domain-containing protein n=1 Tax=Enterobacter cloacae complex sp. 2DZ2F20B TaxID=2511993 RepID=UPI0010275057